MFQTKDWILSDKVTKNSTLTYMRRNCMRLSALTKWCSTFILVFDVIEIETFVIVCLNVVILLSILLIKSISTFIDLKPNCSI